MNKQWNVEIEGEQHLVAIECTPILGKLTVSIDDDVFPLAPKFLTCLFGRREQFLLGEKPALLIIKPFMKADIVVEGRYVESGEDYTG